MTRHEYLFLALILIGCLGISWGVTAVSRGYLAGEAPSPMAANVMQTPVPSAPAYHSYNRLDNGSTVRIHVHDIITVRLPENPTTGYRWNITTGPGLLTLDDTYLYTEPSGRMTGQGGVRFLTLEPEGVGTEQISAVYKRPWEADADNSETFSLTFEVA